MITTQDRIVLGMAFKIVNDRFIAGKILDQQYDEQSIKMYDRLQRIIKTVEQRQLQQQSQPDGFKMN